MKWYKNKFNIFEFKKWKIVVSNLTFLWSRYLLLFIILFHSIGKTLKSFVQKILYKVTLTLDCIFNNSYFRFKLSFSCVIKKHFLNKQQTSSKLLLSVIFPLSERVRLNLQDNIRLPPPSGPQHPWLRSSEYNQTSQPFQINSSSLIQFRVSFFISNNRFYDILLS